MTAPRMRHNKYMTYLVLREKPTSNQAIGPVKSLEGWFAIVNIGKTADFRAHGNERPFSARRDLAVVADPERILQLASRKVPLLT
jgi:hypothetical protein